LLLRIALCIIISIGKSTFAIQEDKVEFEQQSEIGLTHSMQTFCGDNKKKIAAIATFFVGAAAAFCYKDAICLRLFRTNAKATTDANVEVRVIFENVPTLIQKSGEASCKHWTLFNCIKFNDYLIKHNGNHAGYIKSITHESFYAFVTQYLENCRDIDIIPNSVIWFLYRKLEGLDCSKLSEKNKEQLSSILNGAFGFDYNYDIHKESYATMYPWAKSINKLFVDNRTPTVKEFKQAVRETGLTKWFKEKIDQIDNLPNKEQLHYYSVENITEQDISELCKQINQEIDNIGLNGQDEKPLDHILRMNRLKINTMPAKEDISRVFKNYLGRAGYGEYVVDSLCLEPQTVSIPSGRKDDAQKINDALDAQRRQWFFIRPGEESGTFFLGTLEKNNGTYTLLVLSSAGHAHKETAPYVQAIIKMLK